MNTTHFFFCSTLTPCSFDWNYSQYNLAVCKHNGPVDVANVAGKIKTEHPTWNLPERRVNKFVKRYMSENEKNPSVTDDEDAPTDKKPRSKKFSSPSRSFRRFFSPKGKKKDVSVTEDLDTTSDAPPISEPDSVPEQVVIIEDDHSLKKEEKSDPIEEKNANEEEDLDKKVADETDNEIENSSNDCFTPCPIMWGELVAASKKQIMEI